MREAGSIALICDAPAGRSRLASIRTAGLSRSSRSFAESGGAIRLVLATLGPGVLGGDRFALAGSVRSRASLIACGQMATPVFAGADPSRTDAAWDVASGACASVIGEPLVLEPGSRHDAVTAFAIAGDGLAIVADTFALRGSAHLTMRTTATIDGTLVYRDALDLTDADGAFGTVAVIGADPKYHAAFRQCIAAIAAAHAGATRIGSGETGAATIARISGARVWDVRAAAIALAAAARALRKSC